MKKRFAIINSTLMVAVLFSMLLQSVHSFEHLSKLFSEKQCHHKYTGQTEISHQHHPFDKCFVCEFTFSTFITPQTFSHTPHFTIGLIPYCFFAPTEIIFSFSGSSYSLRGPPSAIV
ncbi:hypothetical protein [Flavobacterium sp.]|uniref:hypothetical protein n=1 Tax=Flavobacterium sp. TaxID=239 RepID=UPI00286D4E54|nr:hypothetical protein [Flavobacterium sp.]